MCFHCRVTFLSTVVAETFDSTAMHEPVRCLVFTPRFVGHSILHLVRSEMYADLLQIAKLTSTHVPRL